jgi:xylulokinase
VGDVPEPHILAIDLGTSGPKVAVVTARGRVLGCASSPTPLHLAPGGRAEQAPETWWQAIREATAQLHAQGLVSKSEIVAVAVTAQWAGTVAVDRDGKALRDAIIWMDSRGARHAKAIAGGPLRVAGYGVHKLAAWLRKTGGAPSLAGKEPVAHIAWLRHEEPETYRAAYKFLEPKDYINLRLTGRFAASYDSIALHWVTDNREISRIDYDPTLLRMTTLERDKLPDLGRAIDVLGTLTPEAAADLGLDAATKVVLGTPDVQSAAIGSGAVEDYAGHIYIGTSSWLTCHVPFKKTDILHNMASLPSALPDRYFVANAQETAGACMAWLRDQLFYAEDGLGLGPAPDDALRRLGELAASVPAGSDKILFTPWLFGERSPVADHTVRGAFSNLTLSTTRSHLVRAVMEGVAYNGRWLLGHVEKFVGRRMETLRMIGGGASSSLWCQIHADVLDRKIEQVRDPVQCNARGVALVAALGLELIRKHEIPACVEVEATYEPQRANRALYDELFDEYLALYRSTRSIYARLNRH